MIRRRPNGRCFHIMVGLLVVLVCGNASSEVRVVATNPTIADLARQVGGDLVQVESLMRGPENPHNVIPKPSFVMKVRKADLFVHLGLDSEPWVPNLLRSARQARLLPGGAGNVDASVGIELLEIPSQGELTRALGDIHVYGNTHYVLDPLNGIVIGRNLAKALSRIAPEQAATFAARAEQLESDLVDLTERLTRAMAPLSGSQVVTYHRTWPYFLKRFNLRKLDEVEPKPGIAPGPRHIASVAERMLEQDAGLVIVETFSDRRTAAKLADLCGGRIALLAQEVDSVSDVDTYQKLFEYNVETLLAAARELNPSATSPAAGSGAP